MRLVSLLFIVLFASNGCKSRPFQVLHRGYMAMAGDMTMNGQMKMEGEMTGDMKMSGDVVTRMQPDHRATPVSYIRLRGEEKSTAKIVIVDLDGLLVNKNLGGLGSMGENPVSLFSEKMQAISDDPHVGAILLRINSPGGGVTASDILCHELLNFKKKKSVPIVACIMDVGAGGAYYLATHADVIVAHPTSVVGGIGVLLNMYNLEETLGQFNVVSIPVKAGPRIDLASPEKTMSKEDRALLQELADCFHERFKKQVITARPGTAMTEQMFDGRVVSGERALELGLIDQVGYLDNALEVARTMGGLPSNTPIVMLRRSNDRALSEYDITPNTPWMSSLIPLKVPGLDRSSLPTFLYLWQPEPSYVTSNGG